MTSVVRKFALQAASHPKSRAARVLITDVKELSGRVEKIKREMKRSNHLPLTNTLKHIRHLVLNKQRPIVISDLTSTIHNIYIGSSSGHRQSSI